MASRNFRWPYATKALLRQQQETLAIQIRDLEPTIVGNPALE
jgi:hypothetical protein